MTDNPFLSMAAGLHRGSTGGGGFLGGQLRARTQVATHAALRDIDFHYATALAEHSHNLNRAAAREDHDMSLQATKVGAKQQRKTIGVQALADTSRLAAASAGKVSEINASSSGSVDVVKARGKQERKTYGYKAGVNAASKIASKPRTPSPQQVTPPASPSAPAAPRAAAGPSSDTPTTKVRQKSVAAKVSKAPTP